MMSKFFDRSKMFRFFFSSGFIPISMVATNAITTSMKMTAAKPVIISPFSSIDDRNDVVADSIYVKGIGHFINGRQIVM
jgi:hypothetical protein